MGFPTGKKSIEALASNSSLVSEKAKWTTELIVNFVPLPPEKEEAYWAAIQYFAEIMFAEELTVPAAELETVSQDEEEVVLDHFTF